MFWKKQEETQDYYVEYEHKVSRVFDAKSEVDAIDRALAENGAAEEVLRVYPVKDQQGYVENQLSLSGGSIMNIEEVKQCFIDFPDNELTVIDLATVFDLDQDSDFQKIWEIIQKLLDEKFIEVSRLSRFGRHYFQLKQPT